MRPEAVCEMCWKAGKRDGWLATVNMGCVHHWADVVAEQEKTIERLKIRLDQAVELADQAGKRPGDRHETTKVPSDVGFSWRWYGRCACGYLGSARKDGKCPRCRGFPWSPPDPGV